MVPYAMGTGLYSLSGNVSFAFELWIEGLVELYRFTVESFHAKAVQSVGL